MKKEAFFIKNEHFGFKGHFDIVQPTIALSKQNVKNDIERHCC